MKRIIADTPLLFVSLLCLLLSCSKPIASILEGIETSSDETYGYTAENPIRVGHGRKGFEITSHLLAQFRTQKGSTLTPIRAASTKDPKHPQKILDRYTLVTENKDDTLDLYFDIYHKERIFVPKGLRYLPPEGAPLKI